MFLEMCFKTAPDHRLCKTQGTARIVCFAFEITLAITFTMTSYQCSFLGFLKKQSEIPKRSEDVFVLTHTRASTSKPNGANTAAPGPTEHPHPVP